MTQSKKFVFECQRCGDCCREKEVFVGITDLLLWIEKNVLEKVLPNLELEVSDRWSVVILSKKDGICPLLETDGNVCQIYESRPLFCRSYPLGFNGKNFIIKGKDCQGIGKGKMTGEQLKDFRIQAENEFEDSKTSIPLINMLNSIFMQHVSSESAKAYQDLSDEEREELGKIFDKKKEGS